MRDRDIGFAVVVLSAIAAFCLILFVAIEFGLENGKSIGNSEANINRYSSQADQDLRNLCGDLAGTPLIQCARQILEATNENKRSEKNLIAQIQMSYWSLGALIVSIISTFLTAAGLVFVYLTLRETASGVLLMLLEQRPWVTLELNKIILSVPNFDHIEQVSGKKTIRNRGRSPALGVSVEAYVIRYDAPLEVKDKLREFAPARAADISQGMIPVIFPGEELSDDFLDGARSRILTPLASKTGPGNRLAYITIVTYRFSFDQHSAVGFDCRAYRVINLGGKATDRSECGLDEFESYRICR